MKHLLVFNNANDFNANKNNLIPPYIAYLQTEKNVTLQGDGISSTPGEDCNCGNTSRPEVTRPTWTGHADADGLRAIGWTEDDIAYYQEHGVNWNEEDDQYHLVSDDNKALYGVLTVNNISTYKDRIVYLPKIDTSSVTSMSSMFNNCYSLVSIPQLDTSNVTNFSSTFKNCYSLICILPFNTSKATTIDSMFYGCRSLIHVPLIDTISVEDADSLFYGCFSLTDIPHLDLSNAKSANALFYNCYSVVDVPFLDLTKATNMNNIFYNCNSVLNVFIKFNNVTAPTNPFYNCYALTHLRVLNLYGNWQITTSPLLSKDSLLFIINNENLNIGGTNPGYTIKLASYAYTRLANDPDIVAALANHPNISLAK